MFNKKLIFTGILVMVFVVAATAFAATVEERISHQRQRIDYLARNGQLTPADADLLMGNLNYIRQQLNQEKVQRTLTKNDRKRLMRMIEDNRLMIDDRARHPARRLY